MTSTGSQSPRVRAGRRCSSLTCRLSLRFSVGVECFDDDDILPRSQPFVTSNNNAVARIDISMHSNQ